MPPDESLPCPGCHTLLVPEATGCHICMRARSRQEIMRGYVKLRADKERKRRRPFLIVGGLLLLAGGGKLFLMYQDSAKAAASSAGDLISRRLDDMRNPSNYAMKPAEPGTPAAPAAPAAPGSPVEPENALRAQLFPDESAPPQAPGSVAPVKTGPAAPRPLIKNAWRVTGTVYALATLTPVAGAEVAFRRDGAEAQNAVTDAKGAYEVDLVKGDGWTVEVTAPAHLHGQILDLDPSYRDRDADERRAVLENLSAGDLIPAPVSWPRSKARVALDLFVIPPIGGPPPPP